MKKWNVLVLVAALVLGFSSLGLAMEFNESPEFAAKVAAGELPPVDERLPHPDHVFVVEPYEMIGRYGGIVRAATSTPTGAGSDTLISDFTNPVTADKYGVGVVPHVIRQLDGSDDATTWTFHMRHGMRWSDGNPFTTEDIRFWYEDVLHNEDLTPVIGGVWRDSGGQAVELTIIDEYTFELKFNTPRPFFPNDLIHTGGWDFFVPSAFLKDYHPDYADADELQARIDEAGLQTWYDLFGQVNSSIWGTPNYVGRPGLAAWIPTRITSSERHYAANPYYWKVDTEGNQLPYLDGIRTDIVSDAEVVQGMIMSGQLDFEARNTNIENFPLYRQFEEEGHYRTVLWDLTYGNYTFYQVNQTVEDPVKRELFQDFRFRKALSLAIDREEMNQMLYFGQGEPRQFTVLEESPYFAEGFDTMYTEYDPERANALLDELGMTGRDSSGFRTAPNGETIMFTIEYANVVVPKTGNVELIQQYWQEVGLDIRVREISGELMTERAPANLVEISNWHGDRGTHIMFPAAARYFIVAETSGWEGHQWPLWADYWNSGGELGEEPRPEVAEMYEWFLEFLQATEEERQIELAQKILRSNAENLWIIGTIGAIPHPIIVNKDLRNFPNEGLWGWDTTSSQNRHMAQLFWDR